MRVSSLGLFMPAFRLLKTLENARAFHYDQEADQHNRSMLSCLAPGPAFHKRCEVPQKIDGQQAVGADTRTHDRPARSCFAVERAAACIGVLARVEARAEYERAQEQERQARIEMKRRSRGPTPSTPLYWKRRTRAGMSKSWEKPVCVGPASSLLRLKSSGNVSRGTFSVS